jgi:hypothetical protein
MQKSEFGKCRRNPATSTTGSGQINGRIKSYPAGSRPESFGSSPINGRIRSYPAGSGRFGQIRQYSCRNLVAGTGAGGRIPAQAGYRRPDVVGLWRRLDSDNRQLLNSDNRISNVRVRTKSLVSEKGLRF